MCGSGMKAAMMAFDSLTAGNATVVVAGGMESMTNAPHLLPKGRGGIRYGHGQILDHMAFDGLENAYDGKPMGNFADATAKKYGFSREDMDAYAKTSTERAVRASKGGEFKDEIAPVTVKGRKGDEVVSEDETPFSRERGEDPDAAPGVQQGRHRDRRHVVVDLRRRRGAGDDDRVGSEEARREAARAHRRVGLQRARARVVHHRRRWRDREGPQEGRLEGLRRRPLRGERGLSPWSPWPR
jgi:hypothetical protein